MDTNGSTAVILAGAVAKGAFEAGALEVLSERGLRVHSVMGTSAGALCGTVYAAGIRAGREREAAREMVAMWRDYATWLKGFTLSPRAILSRQGLANPGRFVARMDEVVAELLSGQQRRPVGLSLVVCPLTGTTEEGRSGTTFERVAYFENEDFDQPERLRRLRNTAVASAAFPLAYAPVELDFDDIGLCVDGGVVNNTPVKHAIDSETRDVDVSRVVVITPQPEGCDRSSPGGGSQYVQHLLNILIQERLYRDLKQAKSINLKLNRLEALVGKDGFTLKHFQKVQAVLGWRPVELVEIRPDEQLPGSSFAGFSDKRLREQYIEAGRQAATAKLSELRLQ